MKKAILHIACILFAGFTRSQTGTYSTITYLSKVPIIVRTGTYKTLLKNDRELLALSGRVQIALAPRTFAIPSDEYFNLNRPLPVNDYANIEYSLLVSNSRGEKWLPLPIRKKQTSAFPYDQLLADLVLEPSDSLVLKFRSKSTHQNLQQYSFVRPQWLPVIIAYKLKGMVDTLDNRIKSLSANDKKIKWIGFDSLRSSNLILPPGKKLELLIRKANLNEDSCLTYRLQKLKDKDTAGWQLTGHLLTLSSLKSNSTYSLEIRYRDMNVANTYTIQTMPYWYQSGPGRYSLIVTGIFLLVAAPYSLYRFRLKKEARKRKQLEEQLTSVHTQLNPHFVFNALSSIEGLVTSKENERANEYLSSFSDIMRDTLKNSREVMISLAQEIDTLEKYLRVEQLRFEFKWIMEIQPGLDLDQVEFPPMLLQPVVENAIKHGTSTRGSEGVVLLNFQTNKSDLVITVRDNGGKTPSGKNGGNGYGLKLTNERIARMQELYKGEKISFNLHHHETGTVATFYFQNWINAYENAHH